MKGYYDFRNDSGLVTDAYVTETNSEENNGMTTKCACCGKRLTSWLSVYYIDECDNELEETYGVTCFKKISNISREVSL